MGTTQRIGGGVKKDPNWGNLSNSVTSIAKVIESINNLDADLSNNKDEGREEEVSTLYEKLENRKDENIKKSISRLIQIGGGIKNISSGKSNKVGRAGLKVSSKLTSFFVSVNSIGIQGALNEIGFGSLEGKTTTDVIRFLTDFCCDSDVGMDEAAAKTALCEVLKTLSEEVEGDINRLEQSMQSYVDSNLLSNILCTFFGKYIYEYLWERLEERLRQIRGQEISRATFDSINKEIQGRVILLNSNRPLSRVNWGGNEGQKEIENIFETILKIEGE